MLHVFWSVNTQTSSFCTPCTDLNPTLWQPRHNVLLQHWKVVALVSSSLNKFSQNSTWSLAVFPFLLHVS